jgi:subtilisin-like proprotein convertase family protein
MAAIFQDYLLYRAPGRLPGFQKHRDSLNQLTILMQSKITINNLLRNARRVVALTFFSVLLTGLASAQVYTNGPLSTGATSSNGTAAPAGYTWSEVQAGNTNAGFGANITANLTVADNFTVPAGPSWNINTVKFYAYSTGYTGTTSPFVDVRVQIFNTDPSVGAPTPVFGNLTTNRLASSTNANMYRIFNATPGTTRTIWEVTANLNVTLAPGTYWMEWQLGNGGLSNFSPSVTVVGQVTTPGANAKQHDLAAGTWISLVDGVNAQDMPFRFDYTTGVCAGTPTPGNTISSAASVCPTSAANLSLQNLTPGSGVTYQWQSGPAATGPFTNITGATSSTYAAVPTATTFYQAVVTCGGNSGTSTPVQVALNAPTACYCVPSTINCSLDDRIANVTFGSTLNNNSGCTTGGYANYTTTVPATDVVASGANPIRVTVGPGGTEYVGVWIDYNKSGSFEASEFTLVGSGNGVTITGAINIPATALLGQTRMRVRVQFATPVLGTQACAQTSGFGEVEDYLVNITACTPVTITTQAVNRTVDCGANTTFSVVGAGSLPVYYWEYRTTATGIWQNVPNAAPYTGVNTSTLTITGATFDLNGYQYRAVYSGACNGVDFSTPATLTVNPLIGTVTKTPAGNICLGGIQQLSITNTQPATVVTFNSAAALNITIPDNASTTGVSNVLAVSGIPAGVTVTSIRIRMDLTHTWAGDMIVVAKAPNNNVLNLAYALNATGGASATTAFRPTFSSALSPAVLISTGANPYAGVYSPDGYNATTGDPTIPTGPTGFVPTSTAATRNTFADLIPTGANSSTLNGNWTLAMYDYYDDGLTTNKFNNWSIEITYTGGLATGVWTSPTPNSLYTDAAATIPYNGTASLNTVYAKPTTAGVTNYTVAVNNGVCTSAALTVPVTANTPATAVSAVANKTIFTNGTTTFTATVTGGSGYTYQWKVAPAGSTTYTNVANGGSYSGATTATLTVSNAPFSFNGNKYVVEIASTPCATGTNLTSAAGTLTVNATPVVTLTPSLPAIYPGQRSTITAAVSPAAAASYRWFRDGVLITGATTGTLVADVDALGSYTVEVTDVNGCVGTSAATVLNSAANDILFIYPNPNKGQFQVRYFSELGSTVYPRLLSVYDMKGAKVFTKSYAINSPYTRMDVDMSNHGRGVYQVELTDNEGKRIKVGRVLVH